MSEPLLQNYRMSEQVQELFTALSSAQKVMAGATKDATNPHFGNKYADLASVWDACREALTDNGLAVFQPVTAEGSRVTVTTLLAHKSGQWIASDLTLTSDKPTAQGVGSAITYGRRYGLSAMVGIAPEDDDGNLASSGKQAQQEVAQRKMAAGKSKQPEATHVNGSDPEAEAPANLPSELHRLFQKEVPAGATGTAFVFVKKALKEAFPQNGDEEYLRILERNGITAKGNPIGQVRNAVMQCWTLAQSVKRLQQKQAPETVDVAAEAWSEGRE